jgi:hypothetical protein
MATRQHDLGMRGFLQHRKAKFHERNDNMVHILKEPKRTVDSATRNCE